MLTVALEDKFGLEGKVMAVGATFYSFEKVPTDGGDVTKYKCRKAMQQQAKRSVASSVAPLYAI